MTRNAPQKASAGWYNQHMSGLRFGVGSFLVAAGGVLVAASLPMTWYYAERPVNPSLSGWAVFTNLRIWLLVAAVLAVASLALRRGRVAVVVRAFLGVAAGAPVLRRIVDAPDASIHLNNRFGLYVALVGSLAMIAGALFSAARQAAEELGWDLPGVPANRPLLGGGGSGAAAAVPPAEPIIDAEVVEER